MKITEFSSERLRESYTRIDHRSGLPIYVFPKKLTTTYAGLSVNCGSIDNHYLCGGREHRVPDGVAHFLEHKLFEAEDGSDSFERFAALGADANAFTAYNRTTYLFTCTSHFDQALAELLHFVTHPHFTPTSVQKERGIIEQEICEYEDNPWERCYQQLLESLYESHPVRVNICGSAESLEEITDRVLYDFYGAFYDLSNMALVVCGDVTPEEVAAVADAVLPAEPPQREPITRLYPKEPPHAFRRYAETRMQVAKPIFCIGIKDPHVPNEPYACLRRDTALTLLDEILFSRAGDFYNDLFEEGVISPSFGGGYSSARDFGFHSLTGESDHPELVLERLRTELEKIAREGLSEEIFARCQRVLYADELRSYDSTEEIGVRLSGFIFEGVEIFDYLDTLRDIKKEELEKLAKEVFCEDYISLSVIRPFEDGVAKEEEDEA